MEFINWTFKYLQSQGYGVEEMSDGRIDLYSPKHLFIDQFKSAKHLRDWVDENILEEGES